MGRTRQMFLAVLLSGIRERKYCSFFVKHCRDIWN